MCITLGSESSLHIIIDKKANEIFALPPPFHFIFCKYTILTKIHRFWKIHYDILHTVCDIRTLTSSGRCTLSDVRIASGAGYWSVFGVKTSSEKYKVKFTLEQAMKVHGEYMYDSTLSLTSSSDWGGQRDIPAALPPRKTRYPFYRRLGRPQDQFGQVRQNSATPGFDPRTVQPVAIRYTD
jgi:hypothetical protein